ncbi:hypothetical protein BVRB_5g114300 [Beta vulgaris subsp. vulgaris]|uniref:pentatricopeptide repeat-containing protein At2g20540 n=1 Tax=Beta vulgaris subsp. vulgaris TaxID=3555 RepID=UPI00053FF5CA|nr:pentatricopeptide repeat-containing protein At2g20540 [Beta vulgaris subsp. vulgaris]XP_010678471.1 pentatricopeptide repeat-containing protein At2g20540 [Beta vulgaris subsp. vulgaris]XP_010678472.1 pentatricopeptide repeat-containing protein At2g20540 [Beta vulgaris subsp. vulgaris]XP_010678473.1 pentatricopeptide repeat-containing protein At2g20540 [Beta vulgaris subsp. vulgaris]XP_019105208.1 pentatricopeptide repeat-containing protein At2g20540 [Beta vulgaris subsp. vulgaris]XP_0485002
MPVAVAIPAIRINLRAHQQHIFSLLKTCNSIKQLTQIHAQIFINGFSHKSFLIAKLNSLYATYGYFQNACNMFNEMPNPSTTVWNQVIRGYANSETPQKSVELYSRMLEERLVPDEYTFSYVLSACARSSMFREGEQIHGRVLSNGYCSNSFIKTNLINLYLGLGDKIGLANAYKVFEEMPDRKDAVTWNSLLAGHIKCQDFDGARGVFDALPVRTVVAWTAMLRGCAQNGWFRHALWLFQEMRRASLELDQVSLVVALSVCAEIGDLSIGKWIHSYVIKASDGEGRDVCVRLHNALVHMYASCGVIEEAYRIFRDMTRRTVVSWTTMIMGYAKHGSTRKALEVFECMQNTGGVKPDARTFLGVLTACSHGGYVEEGRRYFKEMEEKWAINPNIEHYGCFIDLLSRAGFLEEARMFIETMPMKPNDVVWGSLLCGCMIHSTPQIASYAAQKLVAELDQEVMVEYLVSVSNVYAMARRWEEMAMVRKKMQKMVLKNNKGKSWVQIDETVHDFMAGDTTHRHTLLIYELLNKLTTEIRYEANDHDMSEDFVEF